MDLKLFVAILVGKIAYFLIKISGKSGGTAAPGLYALKIDPQLITKLTRKIKYGSVLISGTNGKTTTARLVSEILSSKFPILHNRQGSNLLRGIASTLVCNSTFLGTMKGNLGIWEIDEAVFKQACETIKPKIVVLLNLFRDQLDRYGEIDTIKKNWHESLLKLDKSTLLIANFDDPGIVFTSRNFKGKLIGFAVESTKSHLPPVDAVSDINHCPNCQGKLKYKKVLTSHLGNFYCQTCLFKRPEPKISAHDIELKPNFATSLKIKNGNKNFSLSYNFPGLYNVYNVLASIGVTTSFKVNTNNLIKTIENFSGAFGRYQKIRVNDKKITIFLIKNPAGANEVLRTIPLGKALSLLVILNDNFADGRDVSWIWDTNWEILNHKFKNLFVSGTRAWDMALRLKYADIKLSKNNVYEDISYSVQTVIENMNNKDTLIVLPTYTALLEMQKLLAKKGQIKWHEQ